MKSLMSFLQVLLYDIEERCGVSTKRDFEQATLRFEHEGLSFLTITLARFGKDFTKALDEECVSPDQFASWAKSGRLPKFLGNVMDLVFDRVSGTLLSEPSLIAIDAIRQVSLIFAKIHVDCSPKRVESALAKFVETEREVRAFNEEITPSGVVDFKKACDVLYRDMFTEIDLKVYRGDILPGHGPGATADRLLGNEKYDLAYWPRRLDTAFPFLEYAVPSWSAFHRAEPVNFAEPADEIPVRVVTVPKTLETPRIIAIEPTAVQYMQQALKAEIYGWVDSHFELSSLIGFDDQRPNQVLALNASRTGKHATLDLSEASDRVSNLLVMAMMSRHPWLAKGVQACRSFMASVPGHGVIPLSKFASMGSALCFPMEAMVFLAIVVMTVAQCRSVPVSSALVRELRGQVRVYGDDIIVPVEYTQAVVDNLRLFGLRVNLNKSFWTGKFRESCGVDAYAGTDITPVRLRRMLPTQRQDHAEIISAVSTRNLLYRKGYSHTVEWLDTLITGFIPFPRVLPDSPALGRHDSGLYDVQRHCTNLQRPLVKAAVVSVVTPVRPVDDYGALMKFFIKKAEKPFEDVDHLIRSGRPDTVRIKIRWTSPV